MWIVASIPLWMLGGFCMLSVAAVIPDRRPYETANDLARQIVVGLVLAAVFFYLAARVAS